MDSRLKKFRTIVDTLSKEKERSSDKVISELKEIIAAGSSPEDIWDPILIQKASGVHFESTRKAAIAIIKEKHLKAGTGKSREMSKEIRSILSTKPWNVKVSSKDQFLSAIRTAPTIKAPGRRPRAIPVSIQKQFERARQLDESLFSQYADSIPYDEIVFFSSGGVFRSSDSELNRTYHRIGEEQFLLKCNEVQYKKIPALRAWLQRQKMGRDESVIVEVNNTIAALDLVEAKFSRWFLNQGYQIPEMPVLQDNGERKKTSQKPPEYSIGALASKYTELIKTKGVDKPSQLLLSNETGISQSTWSRIFKKQEFWKMAKTSLDDQMDHTKQERDKQETGFETLVHARQVADDHIQKLANTSRRGKEIDADVSRSPSDNDLRIEDLDDEVLQGMSKDALIKEITEYRPTLKKKTLSQRSKEELITLFKRMQ